MLVRNRGASPPSSRIRKSRVLHHFGRPVSSFEWINSIGTGVLTRSRIKDINWLLLDGVPYICFLAEHLREAEQEGIHEVLLKGSNGEHRIILLEKYLEKGKLYEYPQRGRQIACPQSAFRHQPSKQLRLL
jgi:hypothetical protein